MLIHIWQAIPEMSEDKTMLHYTLNTGDTRVSPRSEVGDDIIALLKPMSNTGTYAMPGRSGYTLDVESNRNLIAAAVGLLATVYRGDEATGEMCVFFCVAERADAELWRAIERCYRDMTKIGSPSFFGLPDPRRPESTPWCATILVKATPDEALWIADFERCLAWAWIEGD